MFSYIRGTALAVLFVVAFASTDARSQIQVTDTAGRTVTLAQRAKRILLTQGRHLPALALIHPDPVSLLVGWQSDMRRQDPPTYELYRQKFPALETLPIVGEGSPDNFSLEKALALKPDVVLMSFYTAGMRPGSAPSALVQRFEAAGIPVVIVDFFANPLHDTVASLRVLGKVIGREQQAEDFLAFYQSRLDLIRNRLAEQRPPSPSVFIHVHAGDNECCYSSGKGTFDDFISIAGGRNIASNVLPGSTGQVSLEYVIAQDPQVYVATGGAHMAKIGGFVLGTNVDRAAAQRRLAEVVRRPGLSGLSAVSTGKVHGFWQFFNDSPTHVVGIELLAKWLHPDLFADLDPAVTLDKINRFSAVPFKGTYWVDLR